MWFRYTCNLMWTRKLLTFAGFACGQEVRRFQLEGGVQDICYTSNGAFIVGDALGNLYCVTQYDILWKVGLGQGSVTWWKKDSDAIMCCNDNAVRDDFLLLYHDTALVSSISIPIGLNRQCKRSHMRDCWTWRRQCQTTFLLQRAKSTWY